MSNDIESRILGILRDGTSYKVPTLCEMLNKSDYIVRQALGRMESRGLIAGNRSKRWVEYRIADNPIPSAPRPQLLNRKPYQPGREMRAAMERCAELRIHPSKHT